MTRDHRLVREEQKLDALISMPSGVFNPYAGVSTAILLFTKTNSGGTANEVGQRGLIVTSRQPVPRHRCWYLICRSGKWRPCTAGVGSSSPFPFGAEGTTY